MRLLLRICGCLPGCVFPLLLARSWLAPRDRLAVCNAFPPPKKKLAPTWLWPMGIAHRQVPAPMASMASGAPHNPRPPDLRSHLAEASLGPSYSGIASMIHIVFLIVCCCCSTVGAVILMDRRPDAAPLDPAFAALTSIPCDSHDDPVFAALNSIPQ